MAYQSAPRDIAAAYVETLDLGTEVHVECPETGLARTERFVDTLQDDAGRTDGIAVRWIFEKTGGFPRTVEIADVLVPVEFITGFQTARIAAE